ncbi:MAG: ABC transporter permease [Candidatus Odinarchaeota archaeon]
MSNNNAGKTVLMVKFSRIAFLAILSAPIAFLILFFYLPLSNLFYTIFTGEGAGENVIRIIIGAMIATFSLTIGISTTYLVRKSLKGFLFKILIFTVFILPLTFAGLILSINVIITRSLNIRVLEFTFRQATLSVILSVLCGLPGAYILANYRFPGKSLVKALMTVPFVIPAIVVVLGFELVYGNYGLLNQITSTWLGITPFSFEGTFHGVLMAHVFYNTPVIIRLVSTSWEVNDPEIDAIAQVLGSKGWHKFKNVTLPTIIPGLAAASLLVFIYCFTSFAIILRVGGIRYKTLEVVIYESVKTIRFDLVGGAILALVQLVTITMVLIIYMIFIQRFRQRESMKSRIVEKKQLFRRGNWRKLASSLIAITYLVLVSILFFLPLLMVFFTSFVNVKRQFTLEAYITVFSAQDNQYLGTSPLNQFFNTLLFSTVTALISVSFGLLTAYTTRDLLKRTGSRLVLFVFYILPMATSGIIVAFSLYSLYHQTPIVSSAAWIAVIIAHVLVAFPFINRTLVASFEKINPDLVEVARTLGANRRQVFFQIELPQLVPGMVVSASFAFAISVGEFGATYFIARDRFTTLAIGVYKFLDTRQIMFSAAAATILIAICLSCFLIIERFGKLDMSL